ncbi:MAG: tetratricopeptide repeat protein [Chloroflexi bacterium]|nr:tetratricopeptide repeat protein [Chloroflexota bacterium]
MRSLRPAVYVPLILSGLFALVVAPRLLAGQWDASQARQAAAEGRYAQAAEYYALAAARLPWRADLWEPAGRAALSGGDAAEARRLLEEARSRAALSTEGLVALGDAYQQTGDLEAALTAWQAAFSAGNPSAELYGRLAGAYYLLGDKAAEEDALRGWLLYQPGDAAGHYRLGLLLTISSPQDALSELVFASRLDPEYDPVVQTLRTGLNLSLLESDPAGQFVISGRALALVQEWELAADAFRRAAQADPESAVAWAWLGEAQQHLGGDGSSELARALELDPDSVLVRSLRGLYWQRQGETARALAEFQAAAALEPENPAWQAALGDIYAQSGDLPPALAAYQRAVELEPESSLYWRLLAVFCVQHSVQLVEVGLPAAQKAVQFAADDPRALDVLGWVYLDLNQLDEAEKRLSRALKIAPELASAHLHLAMLYLRNGQQALAYDHLLRARDLSGGDLVGQQAQQMLDQFFR